jgi:hypothetical protein
MTVVVFQQEVGGDLDKARQKAMRVAPTEGFEGEPENVETIEDDSGEPAWAFFWERSV